MATGPAQAVAESIRLQLGTDALVLNTPGPHSCAVVIASVQGYPARLTDARAELDREPVKAAEGDRIAYSITQVAKALGLSRDTIYDQMHANCLASVKVGSRTRQH